MKKTECVIGEIINVAVEEKAIIDGKVDFTKLNAISYNPIDHTYILVKDSIASAFKESLKLK